MTEHNIHTLSFVDRAQAIALEHFAKTAHLYDDQFPEISPVHAECLEEFLSRLRSFPAVLDAACGTGRCFGVLTKRTGRLLGIDQSVAMLKCAKEKYPDIETREVSLQALRNQPDLVAAFDGMICIDSMEWILRAHWPVVLMGFNQVLRSKGYVYITVEIPGDEERHLLARPASGGADRGEIQIKYWWNHFPRTEDVSNWIDEAGFSLEFEKRSEFYRHLILRKRA